MAEEEKEVKEAGPDEGALLADVQGRDREVTGLLGRRDKARALAVSLQNPPVASKVAETKDANAAVVEKVLTTLADSEIPAIIESLDLESCDALMKYLYKFMERPKTSNCGLMLKIHAALSEKAGMGSIVRVLTDRKQV